MALNPEISLGVRVPQINLDIPSPIQQFGQMLTLRQLMDTQQIRKMEMEQERMKLDALREANAGQMEFRRRMTAGEDLTAGQTVGILGPKTGVEYLKTQQEIAEKNFDRQSKIYGEMYQLLGTAKDTKSWNNAVIQAHGRGLVSPEQARQYIEQGYDAGNVQQHLLFAMKGKEQADYGLAQSRAKREAEESAARVASEQAQERLRGLEQAALTVPDDPAAWAEWRAKMPPSVQPLIPLNHSPAGYQLVRQYGLKPTQAVPGRDVAYPPEVQAQRVEEAQALAGARVNVLQSPEKIQQDLDIKKRELELQNQTNISKAMSGDAAKVYSIASNLQPGLEQLRQAFKKDYGGALRGIVLGTDPELAKLAANVADQVGRLRSGGAVNPSEEKRFMDQIASRSDLVVGRLDAALAALDRYSSEAKSVSDNLRPGGPSPTVTDKPATHKYNPATGRIEAK